MSNVSKMHVKRLASACQTSRNSGPFRTLGQQNACQTSRFRFESDGRTCGQPSYPQSGVCRSAVLRRLTCVPLKRRMSNVSPCMSNVSFERMSNVSLWTTSRVCMSNVSFSCRRTSAARPMLRCLGMRGHGPHASETFGTLESSPSSDRDV